jgi:hypothetical protein
MAQALLALGAGSGAMATASTIATIAAPVLSIAGAMQKIGEGRQQEAEFKRQATEERVTSSIRAARMRRDARLAQSRNRTAMAESGALSVSGEGVLKQNAVAAELDALTVQYQGEQQARSSEARGRASRVSPLTVFSAAINSFNQMDPLNVGGQI